MAKTKKTLLDMELKRRRKCARVGKKKTGKPNMLAGANEMIDAYQEDKK